MSSTNMANIPETDDSKDTHVDEENNQSHGEKKSHDKKKETFDSSGLFHFCKERSFTDAIVVSTVLFMLLLFIFI